MPDVLTPHACDALLARISELTAALGEGPGKNPFEGYKTTRVYNLLAHGKAFEEIAVHEKILPVVEGVLDKGCLVSSLSSISIGPHEAAQPIHADDMQIPLPKPHVPIVCNTMWALTDFTEANGATRLLPGTHRAAENPVFGTVYQGAVAAEMRRGSVLVSMGVFGMAAARIARRPRAWVLPRTTARGSSANKKTNC